MLRILLMSLVILNATLLLSEQRAPASPKSETTKPLAENSRYDPAKVAAAIRDSYYHPDAIAGINCSISIDWPAFFSALKLNPEADRLAVIQGLKVGSEAARGETPKITFDWTSGTFPNKEQFEDGLKQMVGGFYQLYWAMLASSPIGNASEIAKIEPLPEGGAKVYSSAQSMKLVITTDKQNTPTHYKLNSTAMNATMDFHYLPSPNPVAGDFRRISAVDVSEEFGTSRMNVNLSLDYQAVGGFYIPKHVSYQLVGAYSMSMAFSGCSVSKGATAH